MTTNENSGAQFKTAVERILASNDEILRVVDEARTNTQSVDEAATHVIKQYSSAAAVAGAVAAGPSVVPGWGTVGALGTMLAEMVFVLKLETEMCLALASLHGLDIADPRNRQLVFLLAAACTHEATTGRSALGDIGAVSWEAVLRYSSRELTKTVGKVFGVIAVAAAARRAGRGLLRVIPFLSIGIGAGLNLALTRRVGCKVACILALPRISEAHAGMAS